MTSAVQIGDERIHGWQRDMKLVANPLADIDLWLDGLAAPCHPNDTLPHRLQAITMNVRMSFHSWRRTNGCRLPRSSSAAAHFRATGFIFCRARNELPIDKD
jgi:hypothetical protein